MSAKTNSSLLFNAKQAKKYYEKEKKVQDIKKNDIFKIIFFCSKNVIFPHYELFLTFSYNQTSSSCRNSTYSTYNCIQSIKVSVIVVIVRVPRAYAILVTVLMVLIVLVVFIVSFIY